MESAEEFAQRYLKEKAELSNVQFKTTMPFLQKYFTKDYVAYHEDFHRKREANPEVFVSIETGEQTIRFITKESFSKMQQRHRYTLHPLDGQWQISSREAECFACHGSGRKGIMTCPICGGAGWKDYLKTAT
jgi:hypothetical protein